MNTNTEASIVYGHLVLSSKMNPVTAQSIDHTMSYSYDRPGLQYCKASTSVVVGQAQYYDDSTMDTVGGGSKHPRPQMDYRGRYTIASP